ncbi:MAG: HU family DNA-binding protein, partial [Akkermansia sp.]|nr:HU family DNA-binding protein [Akkermansia sp.]
IAHFGTFEQVHRPARQGFDINTRTMRDIPGKTELTFRAASRLEEIVIGKPAADK